MFLLQTVRIYLIKNAGTPLLGNVFTDLVPGIFNRNPGCQGKAALFSTVAHGNVALRTCAWKKKDTPSKQQLSGDKRTMDIQTNSPPPRANGRGSGLFLWIAAASTAACATWIVAWIAGAVESGATANFDAHVLLSLRNPLDSADPLGPGWVEELVRDLTALGSTGVLSVMFVSAEGYLLLRRRRTDALFLLAVFGGGIMLSLVLKHGFLRPRPYIGPLAARVYTSGFPSGHAMLSAVAYLTFATLGGQNGNDWRIRFYLVSVATVLTLSVGASRVYMGVHWPTDVLAGWVAGISWTIVCLLVARCLGIHIGKA